MTLEIIAEIGVNHNGRVQQAMMLAECAKHAGCTAVKTQLWNTERVYPRDRWDQMKRLELSRDSIKILSAFCAGIGIEFICTPDEIEDAIFLKDLGIKRMKTSSQDVTNLKFLRQIGELGLPVIFSTGACGWNEMMEGRAAIGRMDTTVLHCVSAYPAPLEEMNLRVLDHLSSMWPERRIGLSDHTIGDEAAVMAVAMGATVFEKHLTFSRFSEGPDHFASITMDMMRAYVKRLQTCYAALGSGDKRVMPCELENRKKFEAFIAPRK